MLENSVFGIQEIFACEIRNPGLWNPEYNSRDPESFQRLELIQSPSSTDKDWNPVPGIRNPCMQSRIQDCLGFTYMNLHNLVPRFSLSLRRDG